MKSIFILYIIFLSYFSYSQIPEQIALNYYSEKILNNEQAESNSYHKVINLRFDKKINIPDSQYQKLARSIIEEFYYCKLSSLDSNQEEMKLSYSTWESIKNQIDTFTFDMTIEKKDLKIPENIRYKEKLRYKELKGGLINFYSKKLWQLFFKEKFNLRIEPSVQFKGSDYVMLRIDKHNYEYGDICIVKITNSDVIDWCLYSWIQ